MKLQCRHPAEWRVRRLGIEVCLMCETVTDYSPSPVDCDDPDCPGFFVERTEVDGDLEWWWVQRCDHCSQYGCDDAAAVVNFETVISAFHGVSACPSYTTCAKYPKTEAARRMTEAEEVQGLEDETPSQTEPMRHKGCGGELVEGPVAYEYEGAPVRELRCTKCNEEITGDPQIELPGETEEETRTWDVLCQCGWGLLSVPRSAMPDDMRCPVCRHPLAGS